MLKALVKDADVLVENYRPDVKFRLGIDYESLKPINPRLVYASISGFGQSGPYRDRPGVDQIAQGMGGLMSVTGLPGQGPVRVGIPIADLTAGIFAAMGILIALLEREESGEGQWVKSSLLAAQIAMLDFQAARWTMRQGGAGPGRQQPSDQHSLGRVPHQGRPHQHRVGGAGDVRPVLPRGGARQPASTIPISPYAEGALKNRDKLNAIIEEVTATKSSAEWIDILNEAGVPCGPIYKMDEVFADPQVKHLGIVQPVEHPALGRLDLVGQAVTLSRTPSHLRNATPERGEHTDAILQASSAMTAARSRASTATASSEENEAMISPTERMIAEVDGPIGWLVFNNPARRNAVSMDMWQAIPEILDAYERDPAVRVIVLKGAGDKAFVSGADISEFEKNRASPEAVARYDEIGARAQSASSERDQADHRHDPRLLHGRRRRRGARLRPAHRRRKRAVRHPRGEARHRLSRRRRHAADRAGRAGLRQGDLLHGAALHRRRGAGHGARQPRAAGGELEAFVRSYCAMIAENAPLSLAAAKGIIAELTKLPARRSTARAARSWCRRCFESEDYVEGRRAFMEKRKPQFKGR